MIIISIIKIVRSAATVGGAGVEALAGPVLDADGFHSSGIRFETQHRHNFLEVLVAAVDEDLNRVLTTSLYLASMLRIILRQSPGLLVPSPKTLFLGLWESL